VIVSAIMCVHSRFVSRWATPMWAKKEKGPRKA